MKRQELIVACCSDLAGKTRGKAFPAEQIEKRLKRGIGWTPTNVQITCFDVLGETPFGSLGDLVLIPDRDAAASIQTEENAPPERFMMGSIFHMDGRPWEFCTRSILASALERLKKVAGINLLGAFEHEFQFRGMGGRPGLAFALSAFREERAFCERLLQTMADNGISTDTIMKEFGDGQYEVTMGPQQGIKIADHSAILRELISSTASASGRSATFTPIRNPAGVGNGVHIHLSMLDDAGKPVTWDPDRKHELSEISGKFVAGILKYLESIVAITAPSIVSYLRLTPHRWSAAFNNLGFRDREASVRICPVSSMSDVARAAQFNFEFRAADATASPYLQLAAIIHAGVQGIEEDLPVPDATQEDLALLTTEALASRGLVRLPQSLEEALSRFAENSTVTGWFDDSFAEVYVKHKQAEIAYLKGRSEADVCAAYEAVY